MATSEIHLYKTKLTPKLNAQVDDIEYYLSTCDEMTISPAQYVKHGLDITISITMAQRLQFGGNNYNYCSIENSDDRRVVYYFILNGEWLSQNATRLTLSMDSINSFKDDIAWSSRTHITREHKDRFVFSKSDLTSSIVKLRRRIDKESEGLQPVKFFKFKEKITDNNLKTGTLNAKWYLIYKTASDLSPNNLSNPITCYCTSDVDYQLAEIKTGIQASDFSVGTHIVISRTDNPGKSFSYTNKSGQSMNVTPTSAAIGYDIYIDSANSMTVRLPGGGTTAELNETRKILLYNCVARIIRFPKYTSNINALDWLETVSTNTSQIIDIIEDTGSKILTIDRIDRTDSRNMKIIELPYAPFNCIFSGVKLNTPSGWTIEDGMFKLQNLSTEFLNTFNEINLWLDKTINKSELTYNMPHSIEMESKLYHSDFLVDKYFYDSFEKDIQYEYANSTATSPKMNLRFKPTNTINSNFLFHFDQQFDNMYTELTENSEYMFVRRNNEIPLYSNDYVNYIRNGYRYDKKAIGRQIIQGTAGVIYNTAASIISKKSAAGAIGSATAIKYGLDVAQGVTSVVFQTVASEQQLQQKLQELKNSPSSVNGSDDIDLLSYTSDHNKMEHALYEMSDKTKQEVYNLLRLTGYATSEYKVPAVHTRVWYNFIQCEPVFNNDNQLELFSVVKDDIKARYEIGVTVFHKVNNTYDFDQTKENFESWIPLT